MRIIIAGSRGFRDFDRMQKECDSILSELHEIEIVSGGAKGADKMGEYYAQQRGFGLKVFPADWEKHGKSAGYIRNKEMAEYADCLIAFWDGESKGTNHMINLAREKSLEIHIIKY